MFNIIVHRGTRPVLALDIDIWQTQGDALERVQVTLDPARQTGRVMLDGRSVKILHSTSHSMRQLFIGEASFSVADLMLQGGFKLLRPKPLLETQLGLLGRFLTENRAELLELQICQRSAHAIAGYLLKTGPQAQRSATAVEP